jgi:hypothetical protein
MHPEDYRLIPHEDALLLAKKYGETKIIRIGAVIAACRLGDVFRSLWSFHQNQAFVLAEVGGNQGTNSHDAYQALLALTYELGKGRTVGEAVDYMNNETLKNVSLKFAVYGGRNVTVR